MSVRVTSTGLYAVSRRRPGTPRHQLEADQLRALPEAPGVYIFRDARKRPLYVGKSINIKKRVSSHLRVMDQAEMLGRARQVEAIETAGELGALLQEMSLIRALQPPYNCLLRIVEQPWVLAGLRGSLEIALLRADDAQAAGMRAWGAFASLQQARQSLEDLLRRARLCPALSGLDSIHATRGCFAHQLGRCAGACCGQEDLNGYRRRRRRALNTLQAGNWPYGGALGIVEERPGLRQVHVIDRWSYCGVLDDSGQPTWPRGAFDPEIYRLLGRRLEAGELSLIAVG